MQDGLPWQAARQAARSSTAGVAIGLGLPAGAAFTGLAWVPTACLRALVGPKSLQTPDEKVYAMQDGLPWQAARQAARSSTAGVAIGLGLPAGAAFTGLA